MITSQQEVHPTAQSRRPTKEEIEHAAMALRSLGYETYAGLIETEHRIHLGTNIAAVVTDFVNVPEDAQVLLVPPGTYHVPLEVLAKVRFIIGLAWDRADYPVLILLGEPTPVTNSDTLADTHLCTGSCSAGIIGVVLDAPHRTVLEAFIEDGRQFSDAFFNVQWQRNVDAYNMSSCAAFNGWDWMIAAYGSSMCRRRNLVEKGLDAVHEGAMNSIDGIFRPLVQLGERIDRMLGWK